MQPFRYPNLRYDAETKTFEVCANKKLLGWVWGYDDKWCSENKIGISWESDTLYEALAILVYN